MSASCTMTTVSVWSLMTVPTVKLEKRLVRLDHQVVVGVEVALGSRLVPQPGLVQRKNVWQDARQQLAVIGTVTSSCQEIALTPQIVLLIHPVCHTVLMERASVDPQAVVGTV